MSRGRKLCALIIISTIMVPMVFADAPELRNVMPNSWRNLTRLTAEAERDFFTGNAPLVDTIARHFRMNFTNPVLRASILQYKRVYEERDGSDIFYRIIFTELQTPQFDMWDHEFLQALVYIKNTTCVLVAIALYNDFGGGQFHVTRIYPSIDIIRSNGRAKGVLLTQLEVPIDVNEEGGYYVTIHPLRQPAGRVRASYFLINDISENMELSYGLLLYLEIPSIDITASDCLVDSRSPLRYSLQSAFDGNPATSYVANTRDSLLSIHFDYVYIDSALGWVYRPIEDMRRIAIINGYAQNRELYFANNRIKRITGLREIELLDGTLDFQFADIPIGWRGEIRVSEIYRGERYNDTCIAEFNIEIEQFGWLFGDLDE